MSTQNRKDRIFQLLKGIETGDPESVKVVNPDKYIQHNPQTHEGGEGLAALFKRLAKSNPRVNIVRIFSDGDYVFGHTEYDFDTSRVGFEIFRFEGDTTVEHWDNIQPRKGPNPSGHSMVDGPTEALEHDKTESNRAIVASFLDNVLVNGQLVNLMNTIDKDNYIEHNPNIANGADGLVAALSASDNGVDRDINYEKVHRVLADGNFVMSMSEGYKNTVHTSFVDLFYLKNGKITEHWDTTETVPPRSDWNNDNGKF